MKQSVIKTKNIGICEIDIEEAIKTWDDARDSVSQFSDRYFLSGRNFQAQISQEQAHKIIVNRDLFAEGESRKSRRWIAPY